MNRFLEAGREYARNAADWNASECACRGRGWTLTPFDTWTTCPLHFAGQSYPEFEEDPCEDPVAACKQCSRPVEAAIEGELTCSECWGDREEQKQREIDRRPKDG